jgi:hypothetical protein
MGGATQAQRARVVPAQSEPTTRPYGTVIAVAMMEKLIKGSTPSRRVGRRVVRRLHTLERAREGGNWFIRSDSAVRSAGAFRILVPGATSGVRPG